MGKNLEINASICDTRFVKREVLEKYDKTNICATVILTSAASKELMTEYSVSMNAATIMEFDDKETAPEVMTLNGSSVIEAGDRFHKRTILLVNGRLEMKKGLEEALQMVEKIIVNGELIYPLSMQKFLPLVSLNGKAVVYPDDAVKLQNHVIIDNNFILRSKSQKYFAEKCVVMTDKNLKLDSLIEREVQFITKRVIVAEEIMEKAIQLVDENVEMQVVPRGYKYMPASDLTAEVLGTMQENIYVDGDLEITKKEAEKIKDICLMIGGTLMLPEDAAKEELLKQIRYNKLHLVKGYVIRGKGKVTITNEIFAQNPEGITVKDCGLVTLNPAVSAGDILEKLQIEECGSVICHPEQIGAVEMIAVDTGTIRTEDETDKAGGEDTYSEDEDTDVINAMSYQL